MFIGRWVEVHEPMGIVATHGQVLVHHLRGLLDVELLDSEEPEQEVVRIDARFVESQRRIVATTAAQMVLLGKPSTQIFESRLA